jgi:hypothetical protein
VPHTLVAHIRPQLANVGFSEPAYDSNPSAIFAALITFILYVFPEFDLRPRL